MQQGKTVRMVWEFNQARASVSLGQGTAARITDCATSRLGPFGSNRFKLFLERQMTWLPEAIAPKTI